MPQRKPGHNTSIKSQTVCNVGINHKEDKVEAKKLIEEYDFYKKNLTELPPALSKDWKRIKPTKLTTKRLLNHLTLRKEEVQVEVDYRKGKVKEAMETMCKLFFLPASSGGGVHYKVN